MTKLILSLAFALATALGCLAQEGARVVSKTFDSTDFPFDREILIYLPDEYDNATESEYDVVYVFDSQWRSRFDLVHSLLNYEVQDENEDVRPYIVVGITSPSIPEHQYCRSNDFLPVPEHVTLQSPYYGSADKFKKFLGETVMPYIDSNYRTTGHTLGVGHSLGASFVIYAMTTSELFDDCIALSPNMEYDNDSFAEYFINYNFATSNPRYIYLSMANESESTGWPATWRPAWNRVRSFIEDSTIPAHIRISVSEFPEYSHNKSYLPALTESLGQYAAYRHTNIRTDKQLYPVHIELTSESVEGDVYITGDQEATAIWNPSGVRMNRIDDNTYAIDLELNLPAEFKFTQGSWDSQLTPANAVPGNLCISRPTNATRHYKTF